ncbi:hypothetical protein ACWEBX_35020 [Streptomyces sp. NPDC005070]
MALHHVCEPLDLGAAIGALVTERSRGAPGGWPRCMNVRKASRR